MDRHILRFTIDGGLSDMDHVTACRTHLLAEAEKFRIRSVRFDALANLTKAPVQTTEIAAEIGKTMRALQEMGLRKATGVVTSAIKKLQLERASSDHRFQFFDSEHKPSLARTGRMSPVPGALPAAPG